MLLSGACFDRVDPLVVSGEAGVVDVGNVEHWLGGDEVEVAGVGFFFVA